MTTTPQIGPNEKLSSRDREALARDNVRATKEAMELASSHREVDIRSGEANKTPIEKASEKIKDALVKKF